MQGYATTLRVLKVLACLVIVKTTVTIVFAYRDYCPPNFQSDFLLGREAHFFGLYQCAFYAHILAGPFALLSGMALQGVWLRMRLPKLHRYLGRANVLCVLALVAPSGLVMACWSHGGPIACVAFALLAIVTAACAVAGWREAVRRRFAEHQVWMQRCFLLLASTVVLRLLGGMTQVFQFGEHYAAAAWASWLIPLAIYEVVRLTRQTTPRRQWLAWRGGSREGSRVG